MTDDLSLLTISYSLSDTELLPGEGNVRDDPRFQSPADGVFLLTQDSPAIDSGDPGSPTDPNGTRTDMGALVYRPASSSIIITEINYNSAPDFDPEDWVELYNGGDIAVDLSGWEFRDSDDTHVFTIPNGTVLESGDYFVLCREASKFSVLFPRV